MPRRCRRATNRPYTTLEMASIAAHAVRERRPVVAAVSLEPQLRDAISKAWTMRRLVYVGGPYSRNSTPVIDVRAVDSTAALVDRLLPGLIDPERIDDPAGRYLTSLLTCPTLAKQAATGTAADSTRLLASRCNFR